MSDVIDPIGAGITPQLVHLALNGALARHAVIAANIANAQTEGYQPLVSGFDTVLERLQGRVTDRSQDDMTRQLVESLREEMESAPASPDLRYSRVELDMQMAALASNTLQYEALLTAQGKLGQIMQLVIGEGKM
jgi:flagellar basal-body rod protein FlgB